MILKENARLASICICQPGHQSDGCTIHGSGFTFPKGNRVTGDGRLVSGQVAGETAIGHHRRAVAAELELEITEAIKPHTPERPGFTTHADLARSTDSHGLSRVLGTRVRNPDNPPTVPEQLWSSWSLCAEAEARASGQGSEVSASYSRGMMTAFAKCCSDIREYAIESRKVRDGDREWWKGRQEELLATIDTVCAERDAAEKDALGVMNQVVTDALEQRDEALAQVARLDVALPALQTELVAFARRYDKGETLHEYIECEMCKQRFVAHDGVGFCSRCTPGYISLDDHLTNPSFWPGHQFLWADHRGPKGRWILREDNFTVSRETCNRMSDFLPDDARPAGDLFEMVADEMKRLHEIARGVHEPIKLRANAETKRATELGDECGRLAEQLDQKRIECDRLRDEIVALRRKS